MGVMTWMPGLIRSAQSLMPLGLPLRVAMTTTESVTMPLLGAVPVLGDDVGLDQAGDVRLEREGDDVGLQPVLDGAALVARGAVGLGEGDVLALRGLLEGLDDVGVGRLRRGVRDQRELHLAATAAAAGAVAGAAGGCGQRDHRLRLSPRQDLLLTHYCSPFRPDMLSSLGRTIPRGHLDGGKSPGGSPGWVTKDVGCRQIGRRPMGQTGYVTGTRGTRAYRPVTLGSFRPQKAVVLVRSL